MPQVAINVADLVFLAVLYGFLWVVARAVRSHLGAAAGIAPGILSLVSADGRVLTVERPTLLGRAADADVSFDDPFMSDRHVRFDRVEGRLVIEDLGSTNGTVVNGAPLVGRRTLDRGDVIRVGQTIMEVR